MSPVEWALGIVSILMSLALGDVALSFHKVMRHRRTVNWDGRVIVATILVLITIMRMWFEIWNVRYVGDILSFPFYVTLFLEFMVLYLLAAACLPDEVAADVPMTEFYEENRRYFWSLFAIFQGMFVGHWVYFSGGRYELEESIAVLGPLAIYVALAFVRRPLLDYAAPSAIIIYYFWEYWADTLG